MYIDPDSIREVRGEEESNKLSFEIELVKSLVDDITSNYLPDLVECNIGIVFRDHRILIGEKVKWACVQKVSQMIGFYINRYYGMAVDVLLQVDYIVWNTLKDSQKKALIHHELLHIVATKDEEKDDFKRTKQGDIIWKLTGHDTEEFYVIEDLYGRGWSKQEELVHE